ncbi:immunoglobulin domain-containing protein [Salmonirosea aquatica]|uniref:Ig-like domain-containing protein n=1 Tax=Salmonirosea aquatica TaxID=2654236 RepID=A0A7C9F7S2_9BACT|nr:hypothetical protein [Cytophagaceae bacterium SJW1-29]
MKRIFTLVLLLASFGAFAQFVNGGFTPVSTAPRTQDQSHMTSDGTGGYVMVWRDLRDDPQNYNNGDIYIQRFDANGNMLWANNGLAVCTAVETQDNPQVVLCKTSTTQPRILVIWQDYRAKVGNTSYTKIFCQAYDLNGNPQYAANGVEIADCNGVSFISPKAISALDGSRVLFVYNRRNSPDNNSNYYVQAANPDNGTQLFTGNGTLLGSGITSGSPSYLPSALIDSQNIQIVWGFYNSLGNGYGNHLYAQRINPSNGAKVWPTALVVTNSYDASSFDVKNDIVCWSDNRNYQNNGISNNDLFAQKINANGTLAWAANGKTVFVGPGHQTLPKISLNAFKESLITWEDGLPELKSQKLDSLGNRLFQADGMIVTSQGTGSGYPEIVEQPDGGAVITSVAEFTKLYVQRLSRDGRLLWGYNGHILGPLPSNIFTGGYLKAFPLLNGGAVIGLSGAYNIYSAKLNYCETPPTAPNVATQYVELNATATLTATGCSGVVNWYDTDHQQGVIVGTGPTFSFTANATATYYAECVLDQCASLTTGAGQARVIIRSVQSGAWNQASTWNCACVPEALDKVVVMPGHNVTLPDNYTAHARELRQEGTLQNSANSVLRLNE